MGPFYFSDFKDAFLFAMDINIQLNVEKIAELVLAQAIEADSISSIPTIKQIASLQEAKPGDLSFLGNSKYQKDLPNSKASVVLVPLDCPFNPQKDQAFLRVENPSEALGVVCREWAKILFPPTPVQIHATAIIHPSARIAKTASIGPYCIVEEGAEIGDGAILKAQVYVGRFAKIGEASYLFPQVTLLDYCELGKRVRLHSGVVVGSDGFGYATVQGRHLKEDQIGNVVIEDDVEIGSNTTIDRARFASTRIQEGSKIDNLVQIAHNVQVGKHCILVSQAGIAGSTQLGNYVVVGGQVGIAGHLKIGDACLMGGQSGVNHDLAEKSYVRGTPAGPFQQQMRLEVLYKRLPELNARVRELEQRLEALNPCKDPQT